MDLGLPKLSRTAVKLGGNAFRKIHNEISERSATARLRQASGCRLDWASIGFVLDRFGTVLDRFRTVWDRFGPFWTVFGPFWTVFGSFWTVFGPFCTVFSASSSSRRRFRRRHRPIDRSIYPPIDRSTNRSTDRSTDRHASSLVFYNEMESIPRHLLAQAFACS